MLNQKKSKNKEAEILDTLEFDDEDDEVKEFSVSASLGGGPSLPLGMSTPEFGNKRKPQSQAVVGYGKSSLAEFLDK